MPQRINNKTAKVRQERDSQSKIQTQKKAKISDVLKRDYSPLDNVICKIGDKACAARHGSVIQRTGLFRRMNESQKVQSLLKLQQQYGNRFVQRIIAQHVIQTKLSIGHADDIYEQKSDRIADMVI